MARTADRGLGFAVAGLGVAAGAAGLSIGGAEWGPRTVPLLAALTLVLAGAAIALRAPPAARTPRAVGEKTFRDGASVGNAGNGDGEGSGARAAMLLGLAVVYVLAIDRIGYIAATALAAPASFALFGVRRPLPLLAAAPIVPLALHLVFFRVLGVFPPLGAWFDVLDVVPL